MTLKQCDRMHYYDGELHRECPYCICPERYRYRDITGKENPENSHVADIGLPLFRNGQPDDDKTQLDVNG